MKKNDSRFCHACGNNLIPVYKEVQDTITNKTFSILKCSGCGLGHTSPVPENMKDFYEKTYYGNRHGFTEKYCIKRRAGIVFSALKQIKGKRLLDIGCGDGSFIRYMKLNGFEVAGTEINPDQSLFHDLSVLNGIESLAASNQFDCITMWHTLEHMPDIRYMLGYVYRLLADDGRLIIAVPNNAGFQAELFKNRWLHIDVPRHIYHFDSESLELCLESNSFLVEKTMYQEFEYDLLGWVQSALNSVFIRKNLFFDFLRGRRNYPLALADILNILTGCFLTVIFVPFVVIEKMLNKSGTVIVITRKQLL